MLAFLLTNLFRPIYIWISKKTPDTLASVLTCLLIIAIVIIPLIFFVFSLTDEALNLYSWGRDSRGRPLPDQGVQHTEYHSHGGDSE